VQQVGRELAEDFRPKAKKQEVAEIVKGSRVRLEGYNQSGTVLTDPRDGKVQVQLGPLKMIVTVSQLRLEAAEPPKPAVAPRTNLGLQRAQTAGTELQLRGMRAEEAREAIERFLDDAILGGLPSVRIVHGKGEGILRKVTRETLKRHKGVRSFRDGEAAEGGQGVTIAEFA
jgi:DNA mismatch repair protein MutS2